MTGSVTQLVSLAIMISAILGAVFLVVKAVVGINRFYRRMMGLYELLAGSPADGENPAKPGLNARMRALEHWMAEHDANLRASLASLDELKPNGGSTMKDQLNNMEVILNAVREQVDVNTRTLRDANESVVSAGG